MDQCFNLALTIEKYTTIKDGKLYMAFMDLSTAFDCVVHDKLWDIIETMGVDPAILNYIRQLYANATASVRYTKSGDCTRLFKISKGVRQGCVLARSSSPYIQMEWRKHSVAARDVPLYENQMLSILSYADDAVLIARTGIGLQRLITA